MRREAAGAIPESMGRYEVLERLAEGGMAEVYVVRARGIEGFQKVVALKRILPHAAKDPDFIRMFLDEARLAATLDHPNVVHVHDVGRADDEYFFTMEYIHGESLARLIACVAAGEESMPLRHVVFITSGVAAGLHHAHECIGFDGEALGIIHRDVSPSNVLVSYEGAVKVVDFGIAKATSSKVQTESGVRKGKTPYMSPEQCRGELLDRRSDVWSLGVLLYEMLVAQRPFRGATDFAVMQEIVHGRPEPPSALRPDIPSALDAIVLRALASDPADRYDTAKALQTDLLAFAREAGEIGSATELADFMVERLGTRPLPWAGSGLPGEHADPADAREVAEAPTLAIASRDEARGGRERRRGSVFAWTAAGLAAIGITALVSRSADPVRSVTPSGVAPTKLSSPRPVQADVDGDGSRRSPPSGTRAPTIEEATEDTGAGAGIPVLGESDEPAAGTEESTGRSEPPPHAGARPQARKSRPPAPARADRSTKRRVDDDAPPRDGQRSRDDAPVDSGLFDSF